MIVGLMPTRGDDWCIGLTLRAALSWVDQVLVFYHNPPDCSADETMSIIMALPEADKQRIVVVGEDKPDWDEMRHRQTMLELGRAMGGTHFAIIDSDEFLSANVRDRIRGLVSNLRPGYILRCPLYNVRNGIRQYHSNGLWGDRVTTVAFGDAQNMCWSGDKFHSREPEGLRAEVPVLNQGDGGVVHLWAASEERLIQKHRVYKIVERLRWPEKPVREIEKKYSECMTDRIPMTRAMWEFTPTPAEWLDPYSEWISRYLDVDRPPWQRLFADQMIELHGADRFAGLSI